ncbi:MAG: hypothetical protein GEU74_17010, partial [Nitriliruptorales bacterium]|nr:hypothetical protein [Nitriliruptorales bacterium]
MTDGPALGWRILLVAVLATGAAAAGIGGRATHGAQVSGDEPQYLLTAWSLYTDGDLDIADELATRRWRDFHEAQLPQQTRPLPGGRHISPHDPLLPLLLAVPMGLGGWVGAKLFLSLIAGITAAATAWVAVRRFAVPPRVALAVVAIFWTSAPLAAYGHQVYPEMPAALAVVVGLAALTGRLRGGAIATTVAAIVALPWLAVKYAPVAAVLALVLLFRLVRADRRGAAAWVTVALAVTGVLFVWVHLAVWGGMTSYAAGDHFVGGEFTAVGSRPNYPGRSSRLLGLLIDREFGLGAWQPAWLLAVPAVVALARRRPRHWLILVALATVGWFTAAFVAPTMHGWWFPGRQTVVILPPAVLTLCVAAAGAPWLRRGVLMLGALGVWSYAWLAVATSSGDVTWIVDFTTVGDPWYREIPEGEPGRSLVLVRTERGRRILHAAIGSGALVLERVGPEIVQASQPNLL